MLYSSCVGEPKRKKSTTAEEGDDAQPTALDAHLVGNTPAL